MEPQELIEEKPKKKATPEESTLLINWMTNRIRRGLGANMLIIGSPGSAKSYNCLRMAELMYIHHFKEPLDNVDFMVDNVADVFRLVRNVKRPGEPLIIEEMSVLAGSRRSMSRSNVAIMQLLDIVRKKQIILMMNAPTIQSIDKHTIRMSHMLLESLRLNKSRGFAVLKPLLLQLGSQGKTYMHYPVQNERQIQRVVLHKPSEHLCNLYETKKEKFQDGIYRAHEMQAIADQRKKNKEIGNNPKMALFQELTETQKKYWKDYNELGTYQKVADKYGIRTSSVGQVIVRIRKKLKPVEVLGFTG